MKPLNFADNTLQLDFEDETLLDNPKGEQIEENESNNLTLQGANDSLSRVNHETSTKNTLNEIAASSPIPPPSPVSPVYDSSETDNSNSTREKFHEKEKKSGREHGSDSEGENLPFLVKITSSSRKCSRLERCR